jgi:NAD(P)-dependent dehydrogenase (short-subunit alcohol dehydrogenase family)
VCLLTGASGTLGTAFCRLHADKYDIAAVYRRRLPEVPSQHDWFVDPLDPLADLPENNNRIFAIQADLTCDRELERIVELVLGRFDRIDLLVNAAVYSVWAPMLESGGLLESAASQFHTNVLVPLKLSAIVARRFWRSRYQGNVGMNRNVVNVSSVAGLRLYPDVGQSVYGASKAALNHLTFHMASEFRPFGVRVNATAPNSFPQLVPTQNVVQAIIRLDQGETTGKILVVDSDGERLTGLTPMPGTTHEV